ncbi:MAG: response regulator transcription factor [Candidatus Gracilibacteria bacterium]|nr:response regulator transcription factor [Candidatus Gracilibacteria bacterium]
MKILIIEDHPKIRDNIITYLELKGYTVEGAIHGAEALEKLYMNYDIIILDMNMPVMNGTEFIQKIREQKNYIPVMVLTSNSMMEDKLEMFSLGADDYLTKPFDLRELEARIIALSRRKEKTIENVIFFGEYELEVGKRVLRKGEEVIEISNKEYGILEYLGRNKGYPKSKSDILEAVWGIRERDLGFDSVTLEAHISTIRKKLSKDIIQTIKGVGYIIP